MKLEIKARAKVNLFLKVLGKRQDGFHNIQTLMAPISLFDKVLIEEREGVVETVMKSLVSGLDGLPWPVSLPNSDNNLATRSGLALKAATGCAKGALITIEKHIPVAAGLGGGSADAAAALRGLNELWGTGLSMESLVKLGGSLGCDVPAMVQGGIVRAEGRGEQVLSMEVRQSRPLWMLLVNPGIEVSTADIYSRHELDLTFEDVEDRFELIVEGIKEGRAEKVGLGLFNSLQKTAFRKYPLLKLIENELVKAGAVGVLLSGSGATIMALARDKEHGAELGARAKEAIGCPVWTCLVATECQ